MITVNFLGDDLYIVNVDGRAWVPIEPVCWRLGIDANRQVLRMRRHHKTAWLELQAIELDDEVRLGIPLEEIHWFIRTLRPTSPAARTKREEYLGGLFWRLLEEWVKLTGRFVTVRQTRDRLIRLNPAPKPKPPIRRPSITPELAERMKQMVEDGKTLGEISDVVGYSKSTISLAVNDKYPLVASAGRKTQNKRQTEDT